MNSAKRNYSAPLPAHTQALPPDPEGMNEARSKAAASTVNYFANNHGEAGYGQDLTTQNIIDLITNLAHFCDRGGVSIDDILRRSAAQYAEETDNKGRQGFGSTICVTQYASHQLATVLDVSEIGREAQQILIKTWFPSVGGDQPISGADVVDTLNDWWERVGGKTCDDTDGVADGEEAKADPPVPCPCGRKKHLCIAEDDFGPHGDIDSSEELDKDMTECQNCGKVQPESSLNEIKDYGQRVAPGEPAPSGECPECGALCHPVVAQ